MTETAGCYCRTSTKDQDLSLEKQERRIFDYAEEQGYSLDAKDVFKNQVSGRKELLSTDGPLLAEGVIRLDPRPRLEQAFQRCIEEELDVLIVLNPSRLARLSHYQGLLEDLAEIYGFRIEYVEASEKWILRKIQSIWDEYEVRQTIKRTKQALEEKPEDEWTGRPPTGYKVDEDSGKLVEADYLPDLRRVVNLYQEGDQGYRKVAEQGGPEVTASRIRTLNNRTKEEQQEITKCLK